MNWKSHQTLTTCIAALCITAAFSAGSNADTGLGRHKKLYAVPAPGKVTVDGKLNDWDLSGQISTYVQSETADMQSAKLAVMYDKQNLYLSAEVRDATPMLNRHDPAADGDKGWNGDSCQFRLVLDPKLPYPLNIGYGKGDMDNPDITTLTLWYYTDKQQPTLQVAKTMNFKPARPEWPYGVAPASLYRAVYQKMADGRGYTFEYAIPWSTLGAKAPLGAGDIVASTVQFNFSDTEGLKTAGVSAWCYDVLAGPGFPYQSTTCWGKLLFSAKGHLPKALVESGVPPTRVLPLKFSYTLPEDSQITIQIADKNNIVQRILIPQADRPAGANTELWDGRDVNGKPLPAGTYTWRGIYHKPLTQKVLFSPMNSGHPPYATDDGKGGWGGDHGTPSAVVALNDGLIMTWDIAEGAPGTIYTDFDGNKQWGAQHSASFIATDGKRLFYAGDGASGHDEGISVLAAADDRPLAFPDGHSLLLPPEGGTKATNKVTGIAYGNNTIYVSYRDRDLLATYDATTGLAKGNWSVPHPGTLACGPDGALLGISDGKLMRFDDTGAARPFANAHLDDPRGIAIGGDGTVYVANAGSLQNVSVFDGSGKYLRSIGKQGGRPAKGRYEQDGMLEPGGIAVDKNGHLWVAERLDFPKRISEWDAATGAFLKEYFGGASYFGYSYIDPRHPDEVICHNVIWKIDWDKNTVTPYSTIWRRTAPDMMWPQGVAGYAEHPVYFTAKNGRQYGYSNNMFMSILSYRDGDLHKPCAAGIQVVRGYAAYDGLMKMYGANTQLSLFDDEKKFPNGSYFWQDLNDDQQVQPNELVPLPADIAPDIQGVDGDLNLFMGKAELKPVRIEPNGRPVYDLAQKIDSPIAHVTGSNISPAWYDPDGSVYTLDMQYMSRWTPTGERMWGFDGMKSWPNSLSLPMQAPGRLYGMTGTLGVAGEFTGMSDYFGTYHVFTRDGVYVGMLMKDNRAGGLGPDVTPSEVSGGQLVKIEQPGGGGRYFLLAGGSGDARVTEIFGLDTVKPLPGGVLTLTDADAKLAADTLSDYNSRVARSKSLSIARGKDGWKSAEPINIASDAGRSFKVRASYDAANLYLAYDVVSPSELINAESDPHLIFKGGNLLDIQMATDPSADPKRVKPAPGDLRILVTRQAGKPVAVVFRPKVKGFTGTPIVLTSPTGSESFDAIEVTDQVGLDYQKTADGYSALITIPQKLVGLALKPGDQVKMDLGVIFGNETGTQTSMRAYWVNNSPTANITHDVPSESRLEPAQWGTAGVE